MDTTRTNANRTANSRSSYLPNITSSQTLSYAQRYQHMSKIANYNQMNESQIWKQYQKLRLCLKQLNQQVLYHMQKKASTNLYSKQTPVPPSIQATLLLMQQEKKTNQSRLQIYITEANSLEQRVQHLTNKTQYLQDINNQIEITQAKIKEITLENKDMKRKQKMVSKDLLTGPSFLEKLVIQEQALHYARKKYDKYDLILKQALSKIKDFNQKTAQYQQVFQTRVSQYKQQQGYIAQQLNLQKFQQLQSHKQNLSKYQTVYKRNYLMKLKQLQNLVNSINRHDQVITQTQNNIRSMRGQIDQISAIVVKNSNNRRRSSISVVGNVGGSRSGRKSVMIDGSINGSMMQDDGRNLEINDKNNQKNNDKNRPSIPRN